MNKTEMILRQIRHWILVVLGFNDNNHAIILWNPITYVFLLLLILVRAIIGFVQGFREMVADLKETRTTWKIR